MEGRVARGRSTKGIMNHASCSGMKVSSGLFINFSGGGRGWWQTVPRSKKKKVNPPYS